MRLQQSQIWQTPEYFIRIVRVERLEVEYKTAKTRKFTDGIHHHLSKKEFCRLLKGATLISPVVPQAPLAAPAEAKGEQKPLRDEAQPASSDLQPPPAQ